MARSVCGYVICIQHFLGDGVRRAHLTGGTLVSPRQERDELPALMSMTISLPNNSLWWTVDYTGDSQLAHWRHSGLAGV